MSLKVWQHLPPAAMSQTDRYGQKIPSLKTSRPPTDVAYRWQLLGIAEAVKEKSSQFARDRARKVFRRWTGMQLKLWKAAENHLWIQSAAFPWESRACLSVPATKIFTPTGREVRVNDRLPWCTFISRAFSKRCTSGFIRMCSCSTSESLLRWETRELCLVRRREWSSAISSETLVSARSGGWCQGLCLQSLQTDCGLRFYLWLDLENDVVSLRIMGGHRLWANVFSIQPRPVRARAFTSILKWLFREGVVWDGQGSPFPESS